MDIQSEPHVFKYICTNFSGKRRRYRRLLWQTSIPNRHSTTRGYVLIIMGDGSANIGDKAVEGISGTHGLGDRNEAGERIIEFCEANQLIVTNTWYKQPRRRLFASPDGLHRNQIDYILIQKRWRSMVKSAKKNNARS